MQQLKITRDNEYYTPKRIIDMLGSFEYDPATTEEKAKEFNIKHYDTINTNGLTKDWSIYKSIWINPPFTLKKEFLIKAVETYKKNPYIYIYILLPIEFLTTRSFKNIVQDIKFELYIPNGRISFESGLGKKGKQPAFGSIIIKLQDTYNIKLIDIK